ncbi:DUF2207 domain-containing protein [Desulfovibrio sp. OttesenSCG-928-C06]|nr:DUF2207 domain-containing protein [Desulfovibrio sp. OttesenSCG-928-C06]
MTLFKSAVWGRALLCAALFLLVASFGTGVAVAAPSGVQDGIAGQEVMAEDYDAPVLIVMPAEPDAYDEPADPAEPERPRISVYDASDRVDRAKSSTANRPASRSGSGDDFPASPPGNRECITLYDSEARIDANGQVFLTERITVNARGNKIKRGIERSFPLQWNRSDNKRFNLDIELLGILRDGRSEPYRMSRSKDMLSLRIGSGDVLLEPGLHTYEIRYRIGNQFSRFEQWDEYYYNVVGNEWSLAIEQARFRLILPTAGVDAARLGGELQKVPHGVRAPGSPVPPSPFYSIDFYTGYSGERGKNAVIMPDGSVRTTAPLMQGQSFTVAYTWPRIILSGASEPEEYSPLAKAFVPSFSSLPLFAVPLFIGFVYWRSLRKRRHDGRMPNIIPLFSPPKGLTPGDLRYGLTGHYDFTAFGADILRLVSFGCLKISPVDPKKPGLGTLLQRIKPSGRHKGKDGAAKMDRTYAALLERILPASGSDSLILTKKRDPQVREMFEHTRLLAGNRNGDLFVKYKKPLFLWIFMFFCLPLLAVVLYKSGDAIVFGFVFMFFAIFLGVLLFMTFNTVCAGLRSKSIFGTVLSLALFVPFWIAFLTLTRMGLLGIFKILSLPDGFYSAALLCMLPPVFYLALVPKRSPKGMEMLAQAKGLIMYMKTAEKRRYEELYPPEMSVEHFETLLPYALALGVGETWADTFAEYLRRTGQEADDFKEFSSWNSLRAFSAGVGASAASASSSSGSSSSGSSGSGSGGGGGSGGGSGGGGGGGW